MPVFAGGKTVSDSVIGSGTALSALEIFSGGTASGTSLSNTGKLVVSAGGVAYATVVNDTTTENGVNFGSGNNGSLDISAGGSASGTTINDDGLVNISAGGAELKHHSQ